MRGRDHRTGFGEAARGGAPRWLAEADPCAAAEVLRSRLRRRRAVRFTASAHSRTGRAPPAGGGALHRARPGAPHPHGRAHGAQPLQRMCGIATADARATSTRCRPGTRTRITDTRKTTPGLRALERYAVRVGGGHNHRDNLGQRRAHQGQPHRRRRRHRARPSSARGRARRTRAASSVEVDSLAQLDEALAAGADIVLLDNMSTPDCARRCAARARRARLPRGLGRRSPSSASASSPRRASTSSASAPSRTRRPRPTSASTSQAHG